MLHLLIIREETPSEASEFSITQEREWQLSGERKCLESFHQQSVP